MAIFVDSVGLNTLVSSSFDDTNTISSGINDEIATIPPEEELVGINIHRNGHYGYSTWKQLRVSENPVTRNHRKTNKMTFVVQPGPMRNVLANGDLRVRDRYSALYNHTEPAITQKAYPLVWNVGRHFKDDEGNVDFDNPQRFSIVSSYGNQQIAFANDEVSKLHKFDPDEEQTEYVAIKDMYLENGLNKQDSPLTHWEFLQYRETIFPKSTQQFVSQTRTRPQFESFYRHARSDRTKLIPPTGAFGFPTGVQAGLIEMSQSTWPMDASANFLTEVKENPSNIVFTSYRDRPAGILQDPNLTFLKDLDNPAGSVALLNSDIPSNVRSAQLTLDGLFAPYPIYSRRVSLSNTSSVSNPYGMEIQSTGASIVLFEGAALWEAGDKRQIRNDDGTYTSAPKQPFYDTYENYVEDVSKIGKNYSIIPEFRMSTQVEDYLKTEGEIETDMFDVTGGVSGTENSSKLDFYEIYSNTDFMKNFEVIADDHKDFTNGKVLSLRCKAIKKFLPYKGFYPCQRTVDVAERFYDSFKDNMKLYNGNNVELDGFNYGRQAVMTPLFAPGVLFNTIKSGVAVDYPILTTPLESQTFISGYGPYIGEHLIRFGTTGNFDKRIPFEALLSPSDYLSNYKLTANEPHPSGNISSSVEWDGQGDNLYSMMANNFLAESINFFLPNGQLSSVVSRKQKDIRLVSGSVYGMRVKMRRSLTGSKGSVYHFNSGSSPYSPPQDIASGSSINNRESFTMYSRPSSFGPPSISFNTYPKASSGAFIFHNLEESDENRIFTVDASTSLVSFKDSLQGYNFPFTPPYYHGEGWCHITLTASSDSMTIKELQSAANYEYTRFDTSFYSVSSSSGIQVGASNGYGPQSMFKDRINKNAVQLSASLNIQGIGTIKKKGSASSAGSLVVDTALGEDSRWVIQTKFETPMLNFNHISGSDHITLPAYGSGSVPRGMWHQYGRLPEEKDGVFIGVGPIPLNYQQQVMKKADELLDLSDALGFSGIGTKLGRLANRKEISEAVVAIPFIKEEGKKRFFKIDKDKVNTYKEGPTDDNETAYRALTSGEPSSQIGRSVLNQMEKMKKYIFPPSFDFMNFDTDKVTPIAMYIFEFSHTLTQTDLQDIWQNLPPDIGTEMEVSEVAITHPLLKKELLGPGGNGGNDIIEMSDKLKWMVFKVKQRAANNYFKKTVLRNPEVNTDVESGNVTQDEFGKTNTIQFNWPYDFFSLVEMVRIDSEVEMGNFDEDELKNYVDHLPSWSAVQADEDKIEYIVGGLEDQPTAEIDVPDDPDVFIDRDAAISLTQVAGVNVAITLSQMIAKAKAIINSQYDPTYSGPLLGQEWFRIVSNVEPAGASLEQQNLWTSGEIAFYRSSQALRDWFRQYALQDPSINNDGTLGNAGTGTTVPGGNRPVGGGGIGDFKEVEVNINPTEIDYGTGAGGGAVADEDPDTEGGATPGNQGGSNQTLGEG